MRMVDAIRAIVARYRNKSWRCPLPSTVGNWKKKRKSNATVISMTRSEALVHVVDVDLMKCHQNRITRSIAEGIDVSLEFPAETQDRSQQGY